MPKRMNQASDASYRIGLSTTKIQIFKPSEQGGRTSKSLIIKMIERLSNTLPLLDDYQREIGILFLIRYKCPEIILYCLDDA
jgi:hypothetical protein